MCPGTLELRKWVPIGEQIVSDPGDCHDRIEVMHDFNSSTQGSSASICGISVDFSRHTPGSLVIKIEHLRLKGASRCPPQLMTLGTGIPADLAICIEITSSTLVRSVHFITRPNGN